MHKHILLATILLLAITSIQAQTKQEVKRYFYEVALESEFNKQRVKRIRKWVKPINYYIQGEKDTVWVREIDQITRELVKLTKHPIRKVNTKSKANCIIFLGSGQEYASLVEPTAKLYYKTNKGLFFTSQKASGEIYRASMYVDVVTLRSTKAIRHLLREELTQLLGLMNDSAAYPKSIFYKKWSYTTSYTALDKRLIQLLYHPAIKQGMQTQEVTKVLDSLL